MSRPGGENALQLACYSGHKRFHCLIFQTVRTPDGLVFYMFGPEVGRRHDMTLFRQSGFNEELQSHLMVGGMHYCTYGDAAYMLRPWLQVAFVPQSASPE